MQQTNVSNPERWFSVVAGTALVAVGLTRRSRFGALLSLGGAGLVWRGASGHCAMYEALGISSAPAEEDDGRQVSVPYGKGVRVEQSVTIAQPPEQIYTFFRNFANLPRFMAHLQSVDVIDEKRSHWRTRGPIGTDVEWDAEIINEVPNELIGWRSVPEAQVNNAGSVHFTPTPRGTEVKVILRYDPPGGVLGAAFARLFGEDPAHQVKEDLRALKMLLETGEIATTEGQSTGSPARARMRETLAEVAR
jgi:uncharacterized membrane protein